MRYLAGAQTATETDTPTTDTCAKLHSDFSMRAYCRVVIICVADALATAGFSLAVPDLGAFLAVAFTLAFVLGTWPLLRGAISDLKKEEHPKHRR